MINNLRIKPKMSAAATELIYLTVPEHFIKAVAGSDLSETRDFSSISLYELRKEVATLNKKLHSYLKKIYVNAPIPDFNSLINKLKDIGLYILYLDFADPHEKPPILGPPDFFMRFAVCIDRAKASFPELKNFKIVGSFSIVHGKNIFDIFYVINHSAILEFKIGKIEMDVSMNLKTYLVDSPKVLLYGRDLITQIPFMNDSYNKEISFTFIKKEGRSSLPKERHLLEEPNHGILVVVDGDVDSFMEFLKFHEFAPEFYSVIRETTSLLAEESSLIFIREFLTKVLGIFD